jgi:two-component system chemotaxis response regulator CheB
MQMENRIKVLVVEDSNVIRMAIVHLLSSDPRMQVIGVARNGYEALQFVSRKRPDVILMDIEMPEMDGLEATRRIMETRPVPIILCTAVAGRPEAVNPLALLETGALAFIESPHGGYRDNAIAAAKHLLQTVKLMSEIKVVHRWPRMRRNAAGVLNVPAEIPTPSNAEPEIIGIGASTGGPPVLKIICDSLPADFPVPILVVQHISRGFVDGMADWLNHSTAVKVQVASHGIAPMPGHVYLAPDDAHMEVASDGAIALTKDDPENGLRPSVSRLFQSMVAGFGPSAVGVLLSGMGKDGAPGLKKMRDCGSTTIAQDRESSAVHGMPGEAIAIGAARYVLSASQIAPALISLFNRPSSLQGAPS